MPFNQRQRRMLAAKLSARHVKAREASGATLHYIEGWHAIAEANRIFGYEHWDRQTLSTQCVWQDRRRGGHACLYTARVRISVRAGATTVVREGSGSGTGYAADVGGAHDIALKAAETDATKRALATFGNPFGLALYDKEQAGVRGRPGRPEPEAAEPKAPEEAAEFQLQPLRGQARAFTDPGDFAAAFYQTLKTCTTTRHLYALWERHLGEITRLKACKTKPEGPDLAEQLLAALKQRARDIVAAKADQAWGGAQGAPEPAGNDVQQNEVAQGRQDAPNGKGGGAEPGNGASGGQCGAEEASGQLAYPKEKRLRDKEHLKYVGSRPCLVCGRKPAHAHHVRYAQARAMGRKVSDEFTVPLCALHHDQLHRTGDEPAWWASRGIDPLDVAEKLWRAHRGNDEGV